MKPFNRERCPYVVNNDRKSLKNMLGFNFRLTEIQAAIGIEQLKKLEKIIKKKRWVAKKFMEGLKDLKGKVTQHPDLDVLNGIAYNKKTDTFFVTGKNWDKMFEIKINK